MQRQLNRHMGVREEPKVQVTAPLPIPDDREEPHEEDRVDREPSMRRSHSLRDWESTHHGSMSHLEPTFLRCHSHRAPQGTNPLLGRYLNEDVGRLEEQPIIPKLSRPMFAKKLGDEAKNKVPGPLELNQIFKEYSMLDLGLRRDMNFNNYLEILGLKGANSHDMQSQSNLWGDKRDLYH